MGHPTVYLKLRKLDAWKKDEKSDSKILPHGGKPWDRIRKKITKKNKSKFERDSLPENRKKEQSLNHQIWKMNSL